jgi:hypothetical protein
MREKEARLGERKGEIIGGKGGKMEEDEKMRREIKLRMKENKNEKKRRKERRKKKGRQRS